MEPSTKPLFSPARIVALVLIALALAGLAFLRVSSGSSTVSVPEGAHAGQLTLHSCTYGTERGDYAADCGTLVVPENRHDSNSRLIALPVKRIRALSSKPREPVFRLQGGPGLTNMDFPAASRYANDRDVVLIGYRGVDGSQSLQCHEAVSAMKHAHDFVGTSFYDAYEAGLSECAARLQKHGVDLAGYSLPERVDDFEAARRALGYRSIDLLSESAGTRTALIYAWRYPKSIHRSVLLGVNPPGHFIWYPRLNDAQVHKYAVLCSRDDWCTSKTDDLAATLLSTTRDIPDRWGLLRIKPGNAQVGAFFGLMNATGAASPISSPMTISTWLAAEHGDPSGLWLLSTLAQLAFPDAQVTGDTAAVARTDAAYAKRYFAAPRGESSILGSPGTDFLLAGGRLFDAWPANPDEKLYNRVQKSKVEMLVINGNLDFATPPQAAHRELMPYLPNGHELVLPGLGHTDDFWDYQKKASSHLINTYLDRGEVDTSLYVANHVDLEPDFAQTTIAKIVLAVLLGFAALTIVSLLLLALRVWRRGGLGRKASGAVRGAYVIVLGLGGWFIGELIVLTALPTVALDSEVVSALSIGLPVGLGVFLAWVRAGRPARANVIGLAGALAAALVGAWLGYNVLDGLFAVVTTILGAQIGANLALIVFDLVRERAPKPAPELVGVPAGA